MEKIDPYKNKERYLAWKTTTLSGIPNINTTNSNLLLKYLQDMETGLNVSSASKRGSRSHIRLNALKTRMVFIAKEFETRYNLERLTDITESQLFSFFIDLRNGIIKRKDGKNFKSVRDFVKDFKAFWHWHQKINRKLGVEIQDITLDLDSSRDKPEWVYLTEEEVKKLCDKAKYEYKVLILFLFDTGIRAPTELMNIRVSDFFNDFKELNIREEVSKTFGRRIKLMLCSEYIKEYIKNKNLSKEDCLFTTAPHVLNQYLKRLGKLIFGEGISPAGQKYSDLTMYDFRHCSCCYWLPRYKSESALKYRFGWKKSDKIHYYSELLGMRDTIAEDDLLIDTTKTEIEKQLKKTQNENELLQERLSSMEMQMVKIMEITKRLEIVNLN